MKFKINSEKLKDSLNKIISVTDKKNTRPILSYSLIDAKNGEISISATDSEISAQIKVEAIVDNPGTVCVNAKNLFDILRELPSKDILFEVENNNLLTLKCDSIFYSLVIYSSEEFPQLNFKTSLNKFNIIGEHLIQIIDKTSHAIAQDETRLALNGVFFQEVNSKLRAVATDSRQFSLIENDLDAHNNEYLINGIIIPKKGIAELRKLAEINPRANINFSVDDSYLYASYDDQYLLSIRLIAREYPKYQAYIPSKMSFKLITDKNILLNAIKRIKIMSNEKSNGIKFIIKDDSLTIMANHPSLGHAQESLTVNYSGKNMEIGFNAKYLIDTISTFMDGEIYIEINNELSAVIFKSENNPNHLGLLMPLKL